MNILALLSEAYGGSGGIAQYNRDLLKALSECAAVDGITVLPRLGRVQEELPPKVTQLRAPRGKAAYIARAWHYAAGKVDLVLCGHVNLLPIARRAAGRRDVPIWLVLHGIEAWRLRLHPGQVRQITLVTAVSRYTRTRFAENNLIEPERLKVLPNTVDPMFTPGIKSLELLEKHGLLEVDVLLTVGRLSSLEKYKGQDRVISIMPRLLSARPALAYVIVGNGDDQGRLEILANELELDDHVKFVNRVSDQELVQWYRSADVFVMPSSGEGFGIVFLQAAACGLKVVGGNRDGSIDALRDGHLGIAVDPNSPEQLFRAIVQQLETGSSPGQGAVGCFSFNNFRQQVELILDYIT